MKRALLGLLIGCLTMSFASVALAGQNADAGIGLHVVKELVTKSPCSNTPSFVNEDGKVKLKTKGVPCSQNPPVGEFDVWVVVCNGSDSLGVAGAEWGIEYDGALGSGVDVFSWLHCGALEFPSGAYPASGGGNLVTYDPVANCQNISAGIEDDSVIAVLGLLKVVAYGGDDLSVTPRPVSGKLTVADCQAREDRLDPAVAAGTATFCSGRPGYSPCGKFALSLETTTWGSIKSKYEIN